MIERMSAVSTLPGRVAGLAVAAASSARRFADLPRAAVDLIESLDRTTREVASFAAATAGDVRALRGTVATMEGRVERVTATLPALAAELEQVRETLDAAGDRIAHVDETAVGLDARVARVHARLVALTAEVTDVVEHLPDPDAPGPLEKVKESLLGSAGKQG